jgi:hypothetical protein
VNRAAVSRARALVQRRYPSAVVSATGVRGGARIDVRDGAVFSLALTVSGAASPLLTLFGPEPQPEAVTAFSVVFLSLMLPASRAD